MIERNKRIMWTNKFSGERGYVRSVRAAKGYFENTYDIAEAKKFASDKECNKVIQILTDIGEAANNDFTVVTV